VSRTRRIKIDPVDAEQKRREYLRTNGLLWFAEAARSQKEVADPIRRRQPKIARHMSRRQRIAFSQTRNPIRAIYGTESRWSQTPEAPDNTRFTRNVGPNDFGQYSASGSKATNSVTGAYRHERPKEARTTKPTSYGNTRKTAQDWAVFADQYEI
jgi:hypothetical protein